MKQHLWSHFYPLSLLCLSLPHFCHFLIFKIIQVKPQMIFKCIKFSNSFLMHTRKNKKLSFCLSAFPESSIPTCSTTRFRMPSSTCSGHDLEILLCLLFVPHPGPVQDDWTGDRDPPPFSLPLGSNHIYHLSSDIPAPNDLHRTPGLLGLLNRALLTLHPEYLPFIRQPQSQ